MPGSEFLRVESISKAFGVVQALADVSLNFFPGEVLAIVGENGAGKSTLMRVIEGVFPPDRGSIVMEDGAVHFTQPRDAHDRGIRVIHQEPEIVPDMSVAENIFLGALPRRVQVLLDKNELRSRTGKVLSEFGVAMELTPDQPCQGLGPAQRQMIEIMRAVRAGGRLFAFDEPTSSLTETETQRLFAVIRRLRDEGASIIYISHRLTEVVGLADRIAVLRDGKLVDLSSAMGARVEGIARKMVGRDLSDLFPARPTSLGPVVFQVENMATAHVRDISFSLRRGEILGIGGLIGAGRSELAMGLFGYHLRLSGSVVLDGVDLPSGNPGASIAAGLGLAPEDRKEEALLLERSILDNATLCIPDRVSTFGLFNRSSAQRIVAPIAERLSIKAPSLDAQVSSLSGGNQQKVVLARWLAREAKVLILDEPTRGIDVGAKSEIYALARELTQNGLGLIVISSEMPELIGLSDRVLVMAGGRIVTTLDGEEITEDAILRAAMPQAFSSSSAQKPLTARNMP